MIVWKSDQPGVCEALAHYQIIRRNGAMAPFEPSKIAEAMMKAFMAVHGTLTDRERRLTLFEGLILSSFQRVSVWKCQIRLLALDFKRALLVQATYVVGRVGAGMQAGAGMGRGFFSAAKPNLRNAP